MGQSYRAVFLDGQDQVQSWLGNNASGSRAATLTGHARIGDGFVSMVESLLVSGPRRVVWAGEYADYEPNGVNLYSQCEDAGPSVSGEPEEVNIDSRPFVLNYDLNELVDKRKSPSGIHPLPLLTCEGNGRGGGDYRGGWEHIGRWARNHVAVGSIAPSGWTELDVSGLTE